MSIESFEFFSPNQVMPSNSPYHNTTACITNNSDAAPIDFICSQDNNNYPSEYIENDLYPNIHQIYRQPFVNHQAISDDFAAVNNILDAIPIENHLSHTAENIGYTITDQSIFSETSPHGNSINIDSPLSNFSTNNHHISPRSFPFSATTTPVVKNENFLINPPFGQSHLPLLFSPEFDKRHLDSLRSGFDIQLFDDITPTPCVSNFGTPIHSYLPYIPAYEDFDYDTDHTSTINTVPQTPLQSDTPLFEPLNFYGGGNLFATSPISTEGIKHYIPKQYPETCFSFPRNDQIAVSMATISPLNTAPADSEKKPDTPTEMAVAVVPGTPNSGSAHSTVSEKSQSLVSSPAVQVPEQPIENEPTHVSVEAAGTINAGDSKSPAHSDSAPTTPATFSRLVAIRPRPHDEEAGENSESIRRSKRRRTRSISADPDDDENEDDGEERKYHCPDCGRGFNRKFNMQTHRSTHDPNRVKPFACEHQNCGSRFTRKHDLKRHINGIHKGEKVHECNSCRKPFSRKDAWKRHVTTCGKV